MLVAIITPLAMSAFACWPMAGGQLSGMVLAYGVAPGSMDGEQHLFFEADQCPSRELADGSIGPGKSGA